MKPGRKPQSAAVKKAKGNPGRRRIGADPKAEKSKKNIIQPPSWLSEDGQKIWFRLAPNLVQMKLLTQTDVETFARYCKNFATWLELEVEINNIGLVYEIETASGKVRRPNPAFMMRDRLERLLMSAEANFGLNPAERQRIYAARASGSLAPDLFAPEAEKKNDQPALKNQLTPTHGFLSDTAN